VLDSRPDAANAYAEMHPQNRIGTVADVVQGTIQVDSAKYAVLLRNWGRNAAQEMKYEFGEDAVSL
jgi:hypothetical protein